MYREAYGSDDISALNFSVHGRSLDSGILGGFPRFSATTSHPKRYSNPYLKITMNTQIPMSVGYGNADFFQFLCGS